ncbi:unnamed protein product [Didymodactylos carnosus]|uniref:Uncharacterized protein n=1 Tax=Didymodactylos carnosus TaxID=1234261 RepID=A0A8S2E7Q6_9BILA|nr:unnamed protein product [Didymodactylos carnosus]CAF3839084.1 unnamed protein product [Didymodactylos carnosus]
MSLRPSVRNSRVVTPDYSGCVSGFVVSVYRWWYCCGATGCFGATPVSRRVCHDRFELKDLNQKGSLSFLTFVPSNVDYLLTCLKHSRLTTVSKIVGVYHIQYPHSLTGENIKRDIPVLENLFYPPYKSSSTIIHIKSTIQHKDSAIYTSLDRRSLLLQGHTYPVL